MRSKSGTKAHLTKPPKSARRARAPAGINDHLYLQVARALKKEIVGGVYPVGSQLPTEDDLCERFSVSRYTVREALRRLREDNLVASRQGAGTVVVPRRSSDSYVQDVMSINDLLVFATGARFSIESTEIVSMDEKLASRTGLRAAMSGSRSEASGSRKARNCRFAGPSTISTVNLPEWADSCSATRVRFFR